MILEPRPETQTYVEDCEVCCNPIELTFRGDSDGLSRFDARAIEQ